MTDPPGRDRAGLEERIIHRIKPPWSDMERLRCFASDKAARDGLCDIPEHWGPCDCSCCSFWRAALLAQVAGLRQALETYGEHKWECAITRWKIIEATEEEYDGDCPHECTCGLDVALGRCGHHEAPSRGER